MQNYEEKRKNHPAAVYRVRIDFKPDGWIDRDVVDAIIADNVKAELTLS